MLNQTAILVIPMLVAQVQQQQGNPVTDGEVALRIGTQAMVSKFGKQTIASFAPYRSFYEQGVWHVRGTPPKQSNQRRQSYPEALISATDGRVIKVYIVQ